MEKYYEARREFERTGTHCRTGAPTCVAELVRSAPQAVRGGAGRSRARDDELTMGYPRGKENKK